MNWTALATEVVRRRVELGYDTRRALANVGPLGERTLSDIEKARRRSYDPATLLLLEQALRWPTGRVEEILASPHRTDLVPAPAHLTPAMLAGLDPVRSGVEMPGAVRDLIYFLTDEHTPLTRDEREQVERQLNEFVKTVAMLARRKQADVTVTDKTGRVVLVAEAKSYPERADDLAHTVEVPEQHATR